MISPVMPTYARAPLEFERGEGSWLIATDGSRFLDFGAGIAVNALGHAHPKLVAALEAQARRLWHVSNLYEIPLQSRLADRLCELSGMERVFFGNSGAEANEAAIKIARLYGHKRDIQRPSIVVLDDSFHGRTMATLTATGNRKVHAGFERVAVILLRL